MVKGRTLGEMGRGRNLLLAPRLGMPLFGGLPSVHLKMGPPPRRGLW